MIGKRLLSLILTVVLCMTLVACGNSTKTTDTNKDSGSKDTPAITQPANQPSEESSSDAVSLRVAWWGFSLLIFRMTVNSSPILY